MHLTSKIATSLFCLVALTFPSAIQSQTPPEQPSLSYPEQAWLGALEWCESNGNPDAINKKDRDGTPSYGILQFKPGTFNQFSKEYGIATTSYMEPAEQIAIVTEMILHSKEINWHRQFPACTARLGPPPPNAIL